jgi:hypothetical protein
MTDGRSHRHAGSRRIRGDALARFPAVIEMTAGSHSLVLSFFEPVAAWRQPAWRLNALTKKNALSTNEIKHPK